MREQDMRAPKTFDWPHNVPGRMRAGMQGQSFVTVLDHTNQPGTILSKIIILMKSRKVSNVHVHDATDVYVDVLEGTARGALTLAGDDLEHVVWTGRYQSLWLPPGVPHVAVYPGPVGNPADDDTPDLLALETRTSSVADADIRECRGYGPLLTRRLEELGLIDRVDPSPQMLGQEAPESSCFPSRPER